MKTNAYRILGSKHILNKLWIEGFITYEYLNVIEYDRSSGQCTNNAYHQHSIVI